jgi:hypothetical protein
MAARMSDFVQEQWVQVLCKSLRMTYITASGRPPQRGDPVLAHPEFDPMVVRAMDRKLGKALATYGFSKAYGGGLQLWNPSGNPTQCITAKEEGAEAYAKVLSSKLGLKAYAGSRMD